MSELLVARGLAQDGAAGRARAARAARRAGRAVPARAVAHPGSPRRSSSRPATAPSSTWSARPPRRPCGAGARARRSGVALYAERNCDAARHLYRVVSRAGVDDRRRGRDPGPGQARLRAGAGRAHDRADDQQALPRRAGDRQARAHGDAISAGHASVATVAVDAARVAVGELADRHVVIVGAGENSEQVARAFHAHGVTTMFVANRRRDRAIALAAALRRRVGLVRRAARRAASAPTSSSPPPPRRTRSSGAEELAAVMEARGGRPLLLVDLAVPRDIDPACGARRRRDAAGHGRAAGAGARAPRPSAGPRRVRAEAIVEDEIQAFAGWLGRARGAADADRAARARRRDRRRPAGRERRPLGVADRARPRARRGDRARGRQAPAARADRRACATSTPSIATRGCRCCASCSGSKRRPRPTPTRPPKSAGCTGDAAPARHARAARWRSPRRARSRGCSAARSSW